MRKNLKKFGVFLLLLALFTLVRFPYQHFGKTIYHEIQSQLAKNSILLSAKEAKLSFPALLKFSHAKLSFPRSGLKFPDSKNSGLNIEQAIFQLKILPLFLLKQELSAQFKALNGLGSLFVSKSVFGDAHKLDFSIEGVSIERLPSFTEGKITGTITAQGKANGKISPNANIEDFFKKEKAEIKLNILDSNYQGGDKISGLIEIPAIKNIKIESQAELSAGEIKVDYFSAFCSMGSAKGKGGILLGNNSEISAANAQIEIELTDAGAKAFSGYLALAANIAPDTNAKKWTLILDKTPKQAFPTVRAELR